MILVVLLFSHLSRDDRSVPLDILIFKILAGSWEMVQWVKVLTTKAADLSSTPKPMWWKERPEIGVLFTSTGTKMNKCK